MINKKIFFSLLLLAAGFLSAAAQKSPQDMDRFIDALMKKMTVEEKIGQLNLPVTGEITTGQAKSSDIAAKIKRGEVGGLFNLKGVEKNTRCAETGGRTIPSGHPLAIRYGCHSRIRNHVPYPAGIILHLGYDRHRRIGTYRSHRSQCRRYLMDIQSDGRHQP